MKLITYLDNNKIAYKNNGEIIIVLSSLDLRGTGITELPEGLQVGGSLDLEGTGITELPEGLQVGGSLDLRGTGITELSEGLQVGGYLDLQGTGITELPEGLQVGGPLDLRGTGITELPEGLQVGGSLYIDVNRIGNIASHSNCGYSNRTIFAAWVNGTISIAAGCFLGTPEEFNEAVDKKYSGDAASSYKGAAQRCVNELINKLNKQNK